jgi:hypothetical protein
MSLSDRLAPESQARWCGRDASGRGNPGPADFENERDVRTVHVYSKVPLKHSYGRRCESQGEMGCRSRRQCQRQSQSADMVMGAG